jgi:hypothetical protein
MKYGLRSILGLISNIQKEDFKDKYPEVPFHGITFSCSYFEEFDFLRQFIKKQNMIKKKHQLNKKEKFVDKAHQCFALYTSSQNSNLLYSEVDSLKRG